MEECAQKYCCCLSSGTRIKQSVFSFPLPVFFYLSTMNIVFWVVKHKFKNKQILKSHYYQFNGQSLALGSNIKYSSVCARACVCKRHLLVAAQYLNTLLILRNRKTNWCLGKSLFLLLGSGKLMLPSRTLNSVRMTQRHRIMQRHIRDYSSNLWPTETPNSSEWQEQHDKGSPVKTTSATASKAEFSYGKILTRLCLFGGSITFLSLVLQCPCRFCELYDMLPKKSCFRHLVSIV